MSITRIRRAVVGLAAAWSSVLCVALTACEQGEQVPVAKPPPPARNLTVITPHNERIRSAFSVAFSNWYAAKHGPYVHIEWIVRGTPECVSYVEEALTLPGEAGPRRIPALMFGGGIGDHRRLAERGQSRAVQLDDVVGAFPAEVGGLPTRDAQGRWYATGLSSFGILYNEELCRQRGIAPPTTWTDLADPRFRSWLALADPTASGSNRQCLMLIVQKHGWQKGWSTIVRILANTRALVGRSTEALQQVVSGVSLAGFAVNFDGLVRAEANGGGLKYVNPPGATAVTPDVISVLAGGRETELAEEFVRFCLSAEGQALWGVAAEHRSGFGQSLYHYPLSPQVYETHAGKLAVQENPLEMEFGLRVDLEQARRQVAILEPLVEAACGENHVLLQKAWEAVIQAGLPPAALAELTALPFDESAAYELGERLEQADASQAQQMLAEWSAMFRAKYERVLELAGE